MMAGPVSHHYVIFRVAGEYRTASSRTPDMHDLFPTLEGAWLAAREALLTEGGDPSAIIDLTNVDDTELGQYLR